MKHAIVTGATGFIGQHLVNEIASKGVTVTAVVRNELKAKSIFQNMPFVKLVVCPLKKMNQLPKLVGTVSEETVFYHLAWEGTSGIERTNVNLQLDNVSYTVEAVKTAQSLGCDCFVGAGSIMEFESTNAVYDLNNKPAPTNIYSTAKLTAHYMGRIIAADSNMRFVWPYITNAYGETECSTRFLNTMVRKFLTNQKMDFSAATQIYDFVHVLDVAKAFALLGDYGENGQTYCVGSGEPRSLKEYIIQARDLLDDTVELHFGKYPGISLEEKIFDTNTLKRDTGFNAKISFQEGIIRLKESWGKENEK